MNEIERAEYEILKETHAKNVAYSFIIYMGLINEFNEFNKKIKTYNHMEVINELLKQKKQNGNNH